MQPSGSEFNKHLANEYAALAKFESEDMADFLDADRYAAKGMAAAKNEPTQPDEVWIRDIPEEHLAQLYDARGRLMQAYDHDVKTRYPMEAATAQASFDCWLEQQEENYQPTHIAACRRSFAQSMRTIYAKEQARLSDERDSSRAADTASGGETLVFFDFDQATIKSGELAKLDNIAAAAEKNGGSYSIAAVGHADRAGPEDYNEDLSTRRAKAIKDALVKRGLSSGAISIEGKGETQPLTKTADGVADAENRRVQVSIR
jgi:OOP family OmpA-OmpF porin